MNKVFERQIKRHLPSLAKPSADLKHFFEVISRTYDSFEEDRKMTERSMEISSRELSEANKVLSQEVAKSKKRAFDLEKLNSLMINRELKMMELKKEIKLLKANLASNQNK